MEKIELEKVVPGDFVLVKKEHIGVVASVTNSCVNVFCNNKLRSFSKKNGRGYPKSCRLSVRNLEMLQTPPWSTKPDDVLSAAALLVTAATKEEDE